MLNDEKRDNQRLTSLLRSYEQRQRAINSMTPKDKIYLGFLLKKQSGKRRTFSPGEIRESMNIRYKGKKVYKDFWLA